MCSALEAEAAASGLHLFGYQRGSHCWGPYTEELLVVSSAVCTLHPPSHVSRKALPVSVWKMLTSVQT